MEKKLREHINYGRLEKLIYDWVQDTIPNIKGESEEPREHRVLTCIAYIEQELIELGSDYGLVLIFELTQWYLDNIKAFYLPNEKIPKSDNTKFKCELGTLEFH